jgi:GT2 family glycosyltransferase
MVEAEFPWVRLVRASENLGFGRAVNLVASRTRAPWVAAANSDIRLEPEALSVLIEAGARDPAAGIVAPRLVLPDGTIQPSIQPFPTLLDAALLRLRIYRLSRRIGRRLYLRAYRDPAEGGHVDWAAGAFLLIRRGAFDRIAGFDEEQWLYAEDLDLAWRLSRAGWRTRYEPRAIVHHEESAATRAVWGDALTAKWLGATYSWVARRQGMARVRWLAGFNVAMSSIEWILYSMLARVSPSPRWPEKKARARAGIGLHRLGLRRREELLHDR